MDNVEISEAILVSFDKKNGTKTDGYTDVIEFTSIKTINCVVDEERGNAIDLETGHIYHIIQREYWGNISKGEFYFLKNSADNTLFVHRYHKKDMKDISLLYQMFLKCRAQKKYQEYLDSTKQDKPEKVKKITKDAPSHKIGK